MTNDQIDETLQRLETFADFTGQLEPLTPGLDEAIDHLFADAAQLTRRLQELRDASGGV